MVEAHTSPSTRPKIVRAPLPIILPTIERPEPIEEAASDCNALPSRDNADPPSPALNLKLSIVVRFRPSARFPCHLDQLSTAEMRAAALAALCFYPFRKSFGSLAIFTAIRRASSHLSPSSSRLS